MEEQILITPITIHSKGDKSVGLFEQRWTINEDVYLYSNEIEEFRNDLKRAWELVADDIVIIFSCDKKKYKLKDELSKEIITNYNKNQEKNIDYPLYENLYGKFVQVNDRFESVLIWDKDTAIINNGRFEPTLITKALYDLEIEKPWNKRNK